MAENVVWTVSRKSAVAAFLTFALAVGYGCLPTAAGESSGRPRLSPPMIRYGNGGRSATVSASDGAVVIYTLDGTAPSLENGTRSADGTVEFALGPDEAAIRGLAIAAAEDGETSDAVLFALPRPAPVRQASPGAGTTSSSGGSGGKNRTYSTAPSKGWSTAGGGTTQRPAPGVRVRPVPPPVGRKWVFRSPATPVPRVNAPTIVPKGGSRPKGERVQVRLLCITPGATIIYTVNSGEPSAANGIRVTSGHSFIIPDGDAIVKAVAVKSGMKDSIVAQALFTRKKGK